MKKILWNIAFTILYPFITAFSLLFTAILSVFSFFSRIVVFLLTKLVPRKNL
ncbi:MAG: hypothetical protein ACK4NY_17875 [Spirosomataceae bacterium]